MRKPGLSTLIMVALLLIVALMTVYPLAMVFVGSFQAGAPWEGALYGLEGWRAAFSDPSISDALWTSIWLSLVRTALGVAIGIFFVWILVRTNTPFRGTLEFLFWLTFFFPMLPMVMGWIMLLDPDYGVLNQMLLRLPFIRSSPFNIYSYGGIIWVHLGAFVAVVVMLLAPAFRNMDPALEEASQIAGAGQLQTLARVTLPLMSPAVLGVAIIGFIASLEAFEVELLLGLPAKIYVYATKVYDMVRYSPPRYTEAMALSSVFMLFVFLLILVNRWLIGRRQYTTITGKGYRVRPIDLGRWRWVAFGVCVSWIATFILFPLSFLMLGTFMKVPGVFNVPRPFTLNHWQAGLSDPLLLFSLRNSLLMAIGAALFGVFFYTAIGYVVVRTRLWGRFALDFMSWLPWGVPGVLLGMGLLYAVLGGIRLFVPLYGSLWLLIIAVIIRGLPLGGRVINPTMVQVGAELEEASRSAGASWIQTFHRILLPLLRPSMIVIGILVFLIAMRDISLVVMLYSVEWRVLSILMLEHLIGYTPEKGMVIGVLISVISVAAALVGRRFGMRLA